MGGGIGAMTPSKDEDGKTHRFRNFLIGAGLGGAAGLAGGHLAAGSDRGVAAIKKVVRDHRNREFPMPSEHLVKGHDLLTNPLLLDGEAPVPQLTTFPERQNGMGSFDERAAGIGTNENNYPGLSRVNPNEERGLPNTNPDTDLALDRWK